MFLGTCLTMRKKERFWLHLFWFSRQDTSIVIDWCDWRMTDFSDFSIAELFNRKYFKNVTLQNTVVLVYVVIFFVVYNNYICLQLFPNFKNILMNMDFKIYLLLGVGGRYAFCQESRSIMGWTVPNLYVPFKYARSHQG